MLFKPSKNSPAKKRKKIIEEELIRNSYPTSLKYGGIWMARIVSGDNVIAHNPYEAVEEAGERPLFILHGTSDTRISIQHSYQLRERATQVGANATFWNPDGIEYVRAASTLTAEYETQLITFFRNSLE